MQNGVAEAGVEGDAQDGTEVLAARQPVDDGTGLSEQLNQDGAPVGVATENINRNKGDIFYFQKPDGEMALWQALENTIAGTNPNGSDLFMEITQFPNGQFAETKKSFSDLETFQKGEQIYYEGKFYQANANIAPVSDETDNVITTRKYLENEIFKFGENYYQATSTIARSAVLEFDGVEKGNFASLAISGQDGEVAGSVIALGDTLPQSNGENLNEFLNVDAVARGDFIRVNIGGDDDPIYNNYIALNDFLNDGSIDPATSEDFLRVSAVSENVQEKDDFITPDDNGNDVLSFVGKEGSVLLHEGNYFIIKSVA